MGRGRCGWKRTRCPISSCKATLAAEDHRFRRHPGVDPIAIVRAAVRNVWSGSREGGSTITQQTVKLLLARRDPDKARTRARSWSAKIEEAMLALRLEHRLTKARDPRALSECRVVRQSARGRRTRQPRLLRHVRVDADAGPGRLPRGPAASSVDVQSVSRSARRAGAAEAHHRPHARSRLPLAGRRRPSRSANASASRASLRHSSRRTSWRWC